MVVFRKIKAAKSFLKRANPTPFFLAVTRFFRTRPWERCFAKLYLLLRELCGLDYFCRGVLQEFANDRKSNPASPSRNELIASIEEW